MAKLTDPRPFKIYRNSHGAPFWYQRFAEAWWVLTRRHSLHGVWQSGLDEGLRSEFTRLITNKAYVAEARAALAKEDGHG